MKKGGVTLTHSLPQKLKPSDEDIAVKILAAQGRPMYYQDFIVEVLSQQEQPQHPAAISRVLTQINLDARFTYVGNGEWGLKVWAPGKSTRKVPTITLLNKRTADDYGNDEVDLDVELDLDKELLFDDVEEDVEEIVDTEAEEVSYQKDNSWR
ncbi:DNA-directed RNA polymerase subunit delta [Desulfitobacterium dichloroeliminans]|uniref:DNA-directed RNA polymerase subunit delta n=1 Tax=Desulfitobacterium dichloroeliminans TaxID=233055 RepID=UPI00059C535D|nr:DNA-directed RNA polymerase subunit delta [Desulfitobacterium dichloroeliminans]